MSSLKETHIGDIVAQDYRAASIFKQYGIDFCCNGGRSLESVCNESNLDLEKIIGQLNNVENQVSSSGLDFNSWPLDLLADYIEKKHHRYVDTKLLEINPYLDKITRVHGDRHPELFEVQELFKISTGEFTKHMKKEELILFPFIRKMVKAEADKTPMKASFGSVQNPISNMENDHDEEGERFRKIAELTNNYTTPEDGCNTYRVTMGLLKEFEDDLHLHIHLENNILFPKALKLEEAIEEVA